MRECYEHCKQHKAVALVTLLFAVYSFAASIAPLLDLPPYVANIKLPKVRLPWAAVIVLLACLFMVVEGSYRLRSFGPESNLVVEWEGLIMGPLFLGDDGVWSSSMAPSSSDAARYKYIGIRIRVSNPHVRARKVGPATGVSGLVEFTYDTGRPGWRGSPAAWVHEPFSKITIDVDHDKELILAVGGDNEWSVITNVRRSDGVPMDRGAMQFREAPWISGRVKVSIIHDGEATSKEYEWNDAYSGLPTIRPIITPS